MTMKRIKTRIRRKLIRVLDWHFANRYFARMKSHGGNRLDIGCIFLIVAVIALLFHCLVDLMAQRRVTFPLSFCVIEMLVLVIFVFGGLLYLENKLYEEEDGPRFKMIVKVWKKRGKTYSRFMILIEFYIGLLVAVGLIACPISWLNGF